MNLAIMGHGKMGRLIEQLAPEYGFAAARRLHNTYNGDTSGITGNNFAGADVAVNFSTGAAVPQRRKIRAALAAEGTV